MKTFAIVPVYNENPEKLVRVLANLKNYVDNIVVVDDGSDSDYSLLITHYLLLRHKINRGQGAALQTGTDFAVQNGAEIIIHFDGDAQHNAEDIPMLIKPIEEGRVDFVFGSRYLKKIYLESRPEFAGRKIPSRPEQTQINASAVLTRDPSPPGAGQDKIEETPWTKKNILHPIARLVNYLLTGLKLSDAHNGLRAFNARIANQVYLSQDRMAHATEYLQLVKKNKIRYTEVAVDVNYSQYGQGLKGGVKVVKELLTEKIIKS